MAALALLPVIAMRDLAHGWRAASCLILAVAVALLPVLVLGGLRQGVVDTLIDRLRTDPRVLEIRPSQDLALSANWFAEMGQDPRVGFLLPRARYLASSVRMRGPDSRDILEPRLVPTAPGDPLLAGLSVPVGLGQTVLTERLSIASGAGPGDEVTLIVQRQDGERRESAQVTVSVVDVLPRDMLQADDIFVDPVLETAIERWREGFAVPLLGWQAIQARRADNPATASFASFRLYARDIRDVPGLRDDLLRGRLDVSTRSEEIEMALAIESGLGWVFSVVTLFVTAGFVLTLGLHLAAGVIEKAREYALLRLMGFRSWTVAAMPACQGAVIAAAGAGMAGAAAMLAQPHVNHRLEGLAGLEGPMMALGPVEILGAMGLAALAGAISGVVAGWRAARLQIAEGLRHD